MIEPAENRKNVYETLSKIDVSKFIEKKGQLSYLSWSHAWNELLKHFPDTTYKVYENIQGLNYHNDGKTAWVKTGVTVEGIEHIEYLPIMDFRNKSITLDNITSMDVNKAIQRSLTKAVARHGLGLYIYAGEDLPIEDSKDNEEERNALITELKELANMSTNEKAKETANGDMAKWNNTQIRVMINKLKEGK